MELALTGFAILLALAFLGVPLFVLMGAFIHRSGISRDLFAASYAWLGRFRGGLALSGVLSCAGFAAVCGSSLATAATMTRVAVPPMREFKYNEGFSAGTIAAGGTLGIMIPPSVPLAIYGIVAGEDIGLLFIAGIVPGILLITLFMLAVVVVTTAMIFAIVFSALILAQFVNLTGMPYDLQSLVLGWGLGPVGLTLMICAICVLLGMVFESIGILPLIIPVFLPSLSSLGVDLIWFGILVIIVIELGLITPPIGMNVFTVKSVAPEIPLGSIFLSVMPYIVAMVIGGILILLVPEIATGLPNAMR